MTKPTAYKITTIAPEGRNPLVFLRKIEAEARQYHELYKGSTLTPLYDEDYVLQLHRELAAEKLRADLAEDRAEAKSKECNDLRIEIDKRTQ